MAVFLGVSFESEGKRIPYDTLSNTHPCNKKEHLRTGLDFHKYYFDLQQAQTTVAAESGETGGCQLHQVKKRPWTSQKKGRRKKTRAHLSGGGIMGQWTLWRMFARAPSAPSLK